MPPAASPSPSSASSIPKAAGTRDPRYGKQQQGNKQKKTDHLNRYTASWLHQTGSCSVQREPTKPLFFLCSSVGPGRTPENQHSTGDFSRGCFRCPQPRVVPFSSFAIDKHMIFSRVGWDSYMVWTPYEYSVGTDTDRYMVQARGTTCTYDESCVCG